MVSRGNLLTSRLVQARRVGEEAAQRTSRVRTPQGAVRRSLDEVWGSPGCGRARRRGSGVAPSQRPSAAPRTHAFVRWAIMRALIHAG